MSSTSHPLDFLASGQARDYHIPKTMRQWTTALDGFEKLRMEEQVPVPVPGEGEVLVKIHAVGLNMRDVQVCNGQYTYPLQDQQQQQHQKQQKVPIVPCSDMCGTVIQSNSNLLPPGTRVASIFLQSHLQGPLQQDHLSSALGLPLPGVLTEYRVFPAPCLVRIPEYLSHDQAACLPTSAVTAWNGLNWMRPLGQHIGTSSTSSPSKYVLLQGTSDVSLAGLQAAHAAGYKTIIISSSDDTLQRATQHLGADHAINSKTYWEWQEPVMKATGGLGADIIFETGRPRTLRKSFESVAFGGTINCMGGVSGTMAGEPELHRLDISELVLRRCVTMRGVIGGGKDRFEEMLGFYEEKQIRPVVDKVFGFDGAVDAMRYLGEGKRFGKVVVKVSG
ncbi:related to NADPH quinone oxidoreductase homolog PIG3 [Claviceps purpurea 20.1]|uniref:Related to NADPH quinone oxidoreductase homolog PIG3 n=1 Tax=Claviceps purpurea (strain 20.1) TaxID=1111077 RepID=M1W0Z3_CLAP2|nr:related to NADPH quinone oxidoreductase homolog PIG3 [Claviceps purpurea 20.1]